jgi:hypothetical protein
MRRIRLRLTLANMMIVVAIIAVVIASWELKQRRDGYLKRAEDFSTQEQIFHTIEGLQIELSFQTEEMLRLRHLSPEMLKIDDEVRSEAALDAERALVATRQAIIWASSLRLKYQYAASHPWLFVAPDTPKPSY